MNLSKPVHSDNPETKPLKRPAEVAELDFEHDAPTPGFEEEPQPAGTNPQARKAGLTEASQPGAGPTDDDLAPETLIREDGAGSADEHNPDTPEPADKHLSIVSKHEIGAGGGLNEAEMAALDPVGKNTSEHNKRLK